jgi:hypothetical protein
VRRRFNARAGRSAADQCEDFCARLTVTTLPGEGIPVGGQMMIMLIDTHDAGWTGMVRREVVWGMCPLGVVRT